MKYSRNDEAQADAVGAIIVYRAEYNPKAMAEFFQKLEAAGGGSGPQFLSDHPNPGNRVEAVEKEITNWRPKNYLSTSTAFLRAKQKASIVTAYSAQEIADGAKQGEWDRRNRQTGAMRDLPRDPGGGTSSGTLANVDYPQIKPSDNFVELHQKAFNISHPANWHPFGNEDSTVTIAPETGVAQGAIAFGVVIAPIPDRSPSSLEQATEDLIHNLRQSNPGLSTRDGAERIMVGEQRALSIELAGISPLRRNGQAEQECDWLVTIERPTGGAIYLLFVAPQDRFAELRPAYEKMLRSLQVR